MRHGKAWSRREERAFEAFMRAENLLESGNLEEVERAYLYAVKLGSPHAQINLGVMYTDGKFGEGRRTRAIALLKRALSHGIPQAACNLAQTYRIEGNTRWYHFWLRKAASLGDEDAQEDCEALGLHYQRP